MITIEQDRGTIVHQSEEHEPPRSWRTWLIGSRLPTAAMPHQTIGKAIGLAVFASDALSSHILGQFDRNISYEEKMTMADPGILVVDDEKNIRLTMIQDLTPLGYKISCAMNGEDALKQIEEKEVGLILLDLKMPGINGMEVLRQVVELRPDIRVIIVSAHGGIEKVVEAIKLGAVDFIRKPFAPQEIRDLVARVMDHEKVEAAQTADYEAHLALVKRCMDERHFEAAIEHAKKAIGLYPSRPEAFNLLGLVHEMLGHHEEAMKHYRVALDLDPTYEPAWQNMKASQPLSRLLDTVKVG